MAQCRVEVDVVKSANRTDLTKENLVGLPNQRTRTRDLAVMTISLTDIAANEIKSFVHKVLIFLI